MSSGSLSPASMKVLVMRGMGMCCVAFAAAAAGGCGAEHAAGELVLQVAAQNAVFDQHVALRGVAFVVHVERAAAAADGAVVDHGAERARDLLADAAAERGDALAVEIGFEAVAHRFVQQNAGPAGSEHHGHLAGRRFDGVELDDGLRARLRAAKCSGVFSFRKKSSSTRPPPPAVAALRRAAVLRAPGRTRSCARAAGGRSVSTPSLVATSTWRRLSA